MTKYELTWNPGFTNILKINNVLWKIVGPTVVWDQFKNAMSYISLSGKFYYYLCCCWPSHRNELV